MDVTLWVIIGGAAAAGFAQGVSGFAFSLVALSVWAWVIDPQIAAPMSVFGALVGQLVALPWVWRGFEWRRLLPLLLGGLAGIPVGVMLLPWMEPTAFKFGLGLFLLVYCPMLLLLPPDYRWTRGGHLGDGAAGFIGGVFGGVAGISGPAPTLWTTIRGWSKDVQRGVLQAFNLAMHTTTLILYAVSGRIPGDAIPMFIIIAPVLALPAVLGVMLFRRLHAVAFRRLILLLLVVSGLTMVTSSILTWL